MFLKRAILSLTLITSCISHAALEEELIQRAEDTTRTAYTQINKNWTYPDNTLQPVTAAGAWKEKSVLTPRGRTSMLTWDSEIQPNLTIALDDLFSTEGLAVECSNAARLVRIRILSSLLGEDAFARHLESIQRHSSSPFEVMHNLSWSFVKPLLSEFDEGVLCYPFVNIPEYVRYKPNGDERCQNIIRLSDGTFLGFYPEYFTEPKTYEELEQHMFESLKSDEDVSPALTQDHREFSEALSFEQFQEMRKAFQANTIYGFDLKAIHKFASE